MKTIDKISTYGNVAFAVVLYTLFTGCIFGIIADRMAKHYQAERLMRYDWYDGDCFDRTDINWIIYGINE
jgi:hypothetical protein